MQAIRSLARLVVDGAMLRRLRGPFQRLNGNAWRADLAHLADIADNETAPCRSTVTLYEDHVALQQPHSLHADIQEIGHGRYSHWNDSLIFSTSDNSDPNVNGHSYHVSSSPWLFERRIGKAANGNGDQQPVNYRTRDSSPEAIRADVDYALKVGETYLRVLRGLGPLQGKSLLELGPGHNYGCVMFLSAYGVKPMVLDRFLSPWEEPYHTLFYSQLRDAVAARPGADVRAIAALASAHGYPEEVIARFEAPVEAAPIPSESVDIILSNAVVEHLYDPEKAFIEMHRITSPGGLGVHQIDCRDHRDFSRPLEYLLPDDAAFWRMFEGRHGECGNRYRPAEYVAKMKRAGFELAGYVKQPTIDPAYLDDFMPRLRAAAGSSYRNFAKDDLHEICCMCQLRKPK